jgi:hypothetical protein
MGYVTCHSFTAEVVRLKKLSWWIFDDSELLDSDFDRDRALLCLKNDEIVIVRDVVHSCVDQLRPWNNIECHQSCHDIQFTVGEAVTMLVQSQLDDVRSTYFSPMHERLPFPKAMSFLASW